MKEDTKNKLSLEKRSLLLTFSVIVASFVVAQNNPISDYRSIFTVGVRVLLLSAAMTPILYYMSTWMYIAFLKALPTVDEFFEKRKTRKEIKVDDK